MTPPKVKTRYVYPPIPIRSYDWTAFDEDQVDGAPDAGFQCIGYGATEADAIADFWEVWSEYNDVGD